ncbi:ankyrin repeat domain-containing protein 53 [Octodon degus]|uniref:Ankyrin repeat domain-containing protein 53 n=1 Tax=Octodon degus TaxID=10160 RepID=A0A6P3FBF1_OCTDE|nr:ankyrin repeat domain-containing protein 53 [Octodon degus]
MTPIFPEAETNAQRSMNCPKATLLACGGAATPASQQAEGPSFYFREPIPNHQPGAVLLSAAAGIPDPEGNEWRAAQPGSGRRAEKIFQRVAQSDLETKHSSATSLSEWSRNHSQLFAAAVGNVEWLRFCLNQDRGEIRSDRKGFTAIHFAAQRGKLACLKVLVEEYKFPVDLPTSSGQTPLHLVIHKDNKTMAVLCIHYLLKKGAPINIPTRNGSTALHLAGREGLLGCLKVLVQHGANVHAQDARGCKPIDYCKIWNHRACARFLKDAMWKRDKKDFACEMWKLKRLMEHLTLMEHNYLLKYQKEHQLLTEANFRKWLHGKLPSTVSSTKQEACPSALSEISGSQISRSFYHRKEASLQSQPRPKVPPEAIYRQPKISQPTLWTSSNDPARSYPRVISCLQPIPLRVGPNPRQEHDFCNFLEISPDPHGGAQLRTVDGHWVVPVPQLPFEVMIRMLHPGVKPYRMKVPQGFYVKSILDVPQRRHLDQNTFWTDTMAMNLRETFDEAFLAAIRAHQGLSALPSSTTPL